MLGGEWSGAGPSGTLSRKCANCAGNLTFDAAIGSMVCHMCGKIYDTEGLKEKGSFALKFREKEYADGEQIDQEDLDKVEYVCDSCGAQIVTETKTTATFCAFCGSPTLISRRLTRQFKPDMIIPFSVSKEKALSLYDEFVSSAKRVPKDFRSAKIRERIRGIYMPVWLVTGDCMTDISASGLRKEGSMRFSYDLSRAVTYSLAAVPFSGSDKLSQRMLEAVEPFDINGAVEFNTSMLQGFYAYKYDNLPERMIGRIEKRFNLYGEQVGKNSFDKSYEIGSDSYLTALTGVSVIYCLVPMWFMCYEYEGLYYQFVINGQTGEVCGRLPEKDSLFGKIVKKAGKYTPAIVSIVAALVSGILVGIALKDLYGAEPELYFFYLTVMLFAVFGISFIFVYRFAYRRYIRKLMEKEDQKSPYELDKRPPAEQYFVYNGKIDMEAHDKFGSAMKVGEDRDNRHYKVL